MNTETIIVWTNENCQPCRITKKVLQKNGVKYFEAEIKNVDEYKREQWLSEGLRTAPIVEVSIGGIVIKRWSGFNPDQISELSN